MSQKRIFLLLIFLLPAAGWAQSKVSADTERLQFLADSFREVFTRQKAEALEWARLNNRAVRIETPSGLEAEIMRLENGRPVYFTTSNDNAAISTNTNDLWNGGSLGLNLEGQNMTLGEWDGGAVRTTHQEFNPAGGGGSRVTQGDSPSSISWHATHVAGTMVAEGDVASAQGMAPQALLRAFDWNSDNSEMATEAGNGLLISNHSYGTITGWYSGTIWRWYGDPSVSATEDYNFGRYNSDARAWDQIAEAAPYYLICKSAGNDRNDNHSGSHEVYQSGSWTTSTATRDPDGGNDGYDCVGPAGTAKNILTVAAVSDVTPGWTQASDVTMSSFSGWGPTDDGRIKPDISGNGISLYSCDDDNDADYRTSSGTSMSGPNVAGSLILLQQHYHNTYSSYMRSSTLKGLAIHTANEAGSNPGPDYEFGWGLLDASSAADLISTPGANIILEPTLSNGATWSYTFTANGSTDFSATLAWIDPAAATSSSTLNPADLRLINDLDMRLSNGTTTYSPWVLDPANPANGATNGDNFRDNVEQIKSGILPAGNYTLTITHKNSLTNGSQPFSLIISGIPSIPIANFSASVTQICSSETVTLTNESSGGATGYSWTITPGSGWSYSGGTNATSANPQVTFTNGGDYTISLVASNGLGSDTETKTSYVSVGGLSLPFTEDFESSTTRDRWTIENPDGSTTWEFESVGGNGGSTAAGINNYNYSSADNAVVPDYLVSPAIDLTGYTSATFDFEYSYRRYSSSYSDSLSVWVSTDCGTSWTRLGSYVENGTQNFATGSDNTSQFTPSTSGDWCDGSGSPSCPSFDLTPYVGNAGVKVRFVNLSGWGNDLFVDNINITGTSVSALAVSGTKVDVLCNGASTGSIDVTASGGTNPYSFLWSDGAVTEDRTGIAAGAYSVTISDGSSQTASLSFTITQPTLALSATTSSTDETIAGASDGTASLTPAGGTTPYSYLWSNGGISNSISSLAPGTYSVTLSDANGCSAVSSATVGSGVPVLSGSGITTDVLCNGDASGAVDVTVVGGTLPYSFLWSDGTVTEDRTSLTAGSYSVTISDGSAQSASLSFTISQPAVALSATVNATNETVAGASDGSASLTPAGGTTPYSYLWSNGGVSSSISSLAPGTYSVTLSDANGCSLVSSATVGSGVPVLSGSGITTDVLCNGDASGAVDVTVVGGILPYSFLWSDGAVTEDRTSLTAGSYSVTISDGSSQTATLSFTISQPTVALSATVNGTNETVAGASDGTASLTPAGGTSPYSYLWSNGGVSSSISSLAPGTYSVTLSDANGCSLVSSATVGSGVAALSASGTQVNVLCNSNASGAVDVTVVGGTLPYSFLWSDGAVTEDRTSLTAGSFSVTISDGSGQTASLSFTITQPALALSATTSSTDETVAGAFDGTASLTPAGGTSPYSYLWSNGALTSSISGLAPGMYFVTLSDFNGCSSSASISIQQGPAPAMSLVLSSTNIDCFGGSGTASVTASGGIPPYSYLWSSGATGPTTQTSLIAYYSVTVTDTQGWSVSDSILVTGAQFPTQVLVDFSDSCMGTISLIVTGGAGPYQFDWIDLNDPTNTPTGPTITLQNACADAVCLEASCVITDALGCVFETDTISFTGCFTSIAEPSVTFEVYPNPGRNEVKISSSTTISEVTAYDAFGRKIMKELYKAQSEVSLNTTQWPSGTYFIQVHSMGIVRQHRWVKIN